jgi:hypothetical protein
LLSLCQSCKYRGLSFLKFLKSGIRNVDDFCNRGKPGRGQGLPSIQLYPKEFTPPHVLRWNRKRRVGKDATKAEGGEDKPVDMPDQSDGPVGKRP